MSYLKLLLFGIWNPLNLSKIILLRFVKNSKLYEAKGTQIEERLHWLRIGDRVSEELFQRIKSPRHSTQLKAIQDNGVKLSSLLDISQVL